MRLIGRIVRWLLILIAGGATVGALAAAFAYLYFAPNLPDVAALRDVQYQVPLKVYSADGKLVAEYGEKRRDPLRFDQIPPTLVHAFLAAEDANFYEHPGVSIRGLLRATFELIKTGQKRQGGSTITMQLARNFFLSDKKTYSRKIRELFLALKIEKALTKDQILEIYLNKIYLGNRAYGVGAAAHVYYGKNVKDLSVAQMAMIAGLPKAPSAYNPIADPSRALERRGYVLTRMHDLGFIDRTQYQQAMQAPITASLHGTDIEAPAPYLAEMVRQEMYNRYGDRAYTDGFKVYTTILARDQIDAVHALRNDLIAYTERHGYRGPEAKVKLDAGALKAWRADLTRMPAAGASASGQAVPAWDAMLGRYAPVGGLPAALVVASGDKTAQVYLDGGQVVTLDLKDMSWAGAYISVNRVGPVPTRVDALLKPGDVIRVRDEQGRWSLAQVPKVAGALVSLNPRNGAIVALVGGFDYYASKFNRVTQALRQPGSSFKPFVYSAALHDGYTPATLVNDAPVVVKDSALEGVWRPENYERNFNGPTRLRLGLVHSLNLVSIRVLQSIGIDYALKYASRFGFDPARLPHNLTLALGSASVTPLEMATGYAVFANGGYRVKPFYIERIVGGDGSVLYQAQPDTVCEPDCPASAAATAPAAPLPADTTGPAVATPLPPAGTLAHGATTSVPAIKPAMRVISAGNAYQMTSMMKDVIRMGTGRAALRLHRADLAGKTGTTNDQVDAWFSGFNSDLVTTAWVGFDGNQPLGHAETGARAALPMWMGFMGAALAGKPEATMPQPQGIVTVKIDPKTGLLASPGEADAIFETFREGHLPKPDTPAAVSGSEATPQGSRGLTQQLY
ncbi:transpeptidase-transglycosylase [Acidihalobacter prosperus]|uniref:Penicillin-binding protein 1A n=2 Tax=Acidihalobacter prosperus TaxID=160660 RepID=A0A1A6C0Y8_9GAMM|nr:transpeptidase-transglycosylase [Acidihalobacter prosperus]